MWDFIFVCVVLGVVLTLQNPLLQPNKNQRFLSQKIYNDFSHCVIISKARIIMLSKLSTLSLGLKASLVIK